MKKDLKEIRSKINVIDQEMKNLFIRRMELINDVIIYKKENNLNILDSLREEEVIKLNTIDLIESDYYEYYIKFLKEVMEISKDYQKSKF